MPSGDGSTGDSTSMPSGSMPGTGTEPAGDGADPAAGSASAPGTPGSAGGAAAPGDAGDGAAGEAGAAGAPGSEGAPGSGPALPSGTAQTPEERRAAVDRRLDDSLGTFDERIRKEQEGVASERDSRAGSGGSGDVLVAQSGSTTGARPGDLKSDGATNASQGSQGSQGGKSDPSGSGAEGPARTSAGTGGSGKAAVERADGSDDDIVARRLRRAAEQETDPELKEKLWKEYDDYKRSVQGG
jgi:hypothetical protein